MSLRESIIARVESLKGGAGSGNFGHTGRPHQVGGSGPGTGGVTGTPAFKKWFGDSQVVDENGDPLVVHHGTLNGKFDAFDFTRAGENTGPFGGAGMFFVDDRGTAESYADPSNRQLAFDNQTRARMTLGVRRPDYEAAIENAEATEIAVEKDDEGWFFTSTSYNDFGDPSRYDSDARYDEEDEAREAGEEDKAKDVAKAEARMAEYEVREKAERDALGKGSYVYDVYLRIENPKEIDYGGDTADIQSMVSANREARAQGYDGVIFRNVSDSLAGDGKPANIYVPFKPEQVKSTGNSAFDPKDPNITKSLREMIIDRVEGRSLKNCGTGAGGFKPGNTCAGGGEGEESVTAYHGTIDSVWNSIQEQGLVPAGGGRTFRSSESRYYAGDRKTSVFLAKNEDQAIQYARHAVFEHNDYYEDSAGPLLLKVTVPKEFRSKIIEDNLDSNAIRLNMIIPPEWITRVPEAEVNKLMGRPILARVGQPQPAFKTLGDTVLWAALLVDKEEYTKAFNENQPRDDHGRWSDTGGGVTDTPAFKNWFGDSKVVDAEGKPQVVYHGTPFPDFDAFDLAPKRSNTANETGGLGIWFTDNPTTAGDFATKDEVEYRENGDKWPDGSPKQYAHDVERVGAILPVYLSLQNPKVYESTLSNAFGGVDGAPVAGNDAFEAMMDDRDQFAEYISGAKGRRGAWREKYVALNVAKTNREFVDYLKAQGHDGIIIKQTEYDAPLTELSLTGQSRISQFIAFEPTQIKSAIGNSGKFDPKNPNITKGFNPDEPRDDQGQWTDGGASEEPDPFVFRYPVAKTAKDAEGKKIQVGDSVEVRNIYSKEWTGRIVKILAMHRQGADGTIIKTDPVPDPDYPHHDTHGAKDTRKVKLFKPVHRPRGTKVQLRKHKSIVDFLDARNEALKARGNFGHAGRPGKQGGSAKQRGGAGHPEVQTVYDPKTGVRKFKPGYEPKPHEPPVAAFDRSAYHPSSFPGLDVQVPTSFEGDALFFHGTAGEAAEHIMKEGLIPKKGKGGDAWLHSQFADFSLQNVEAGDRKMSVYMTPNIAHAQEFSGLAKQVTKGKAEPVILQIKVPKSEVSKLRVDEEDNSAVRFVGTIPPSWISKYKGPITGQPLMGVSRADPMAELMAQLNLLGAKSFTFNEDGSVTIYMVVLADGGGEE